MTEHPISPVRSRWRWLQFSLRTLLVATVLIGLGLGWFTVRLDKARRQAAAVAGLRRAGANVFYEHELVERHRERNADGSWNPEWRDELEPPGPEWLRRWLGVDFFARVVAVEISSLNSERDKTMASLLHLIESKGGVAPDASSADTRAMSDFLRNLPDVTELKIGPFAPADETITEETMANIASLGELRQLSIMTIGRVSDNGELQQVFASGSPWADEVRLTPEARVKLTGLKKLERLVLVGVAGWDEGVNEIAELPQLKEFILVAFDDSEDELRELERRRPDLKVTSALDRRPIRFSDIDLDAPEPQAKADGDELKPDATEDRMRRFEEFREMMRAGGKNGKGAPAE